MQLKLQRIIILKSKFFHIKKVASRTSNPPKTETVPCVTLKAEKVRAQFIVGAIIAVGKYVMIYHNIQFSY